MQGVVLLKITFDIVGSESPNMTDMQKGHVFKSALQKFENELLKKSLGCYIRKN